MSLQNLHLQSPLLDGQSLMQERPSSFASRRSARATAPSFAGVNSKSKFFSTNQPKILLETLAARTTVLLLLLTYICFIVCEVIDFQSIEAGFSANAAFPLESLPCPALFPNPAPVTFGCLQSDNTTWTGTVLSLSNVISVQLDVRRSNITTPIEHDKDNVTVTAININYDLNLWACYKSGGCGGSFSKDLSGLAVSEWHQVLTLTNQPLYIDTADAVKVGYVQAPLINITFQNQESVPTNGIVKSYYVTVKYLGLPSPTELVFDKPLVTEDLTYVMQVVNRPSPYASTILTIILLILTVCVTAAYIPIVIKYQNGQWLPEQVWIVIYLVALIAYQNPIYSAITLQESVAPGAAYASYVLDNLAQSTFLVIWLCFADAVHHRHEGRLRFYLPKVLFGLFFFTVSLVTLTYEFPDLSEAFLKSSDRSPVEAVENWPESVKITFCAFSLMFLLLFWVWALWWFVALLIARRSLSRLPYMNTRYLQLSYRFFIIQATLVTLYYVSQYGFVIYKISPGTFPGLTGLTNNINTLFRQQTQLFGKVLFLTTYAFSLAFLFLPAAFLESPLASALRATYVISEEELRGVVSKRLKTIRDLNNVMLMNNLVIKAKAEVFCVDRALDLRNVAYEVYYSPEGMDTEGAEGVMNLESHGYTLVDCSFLKEKSIFVLIARHKTTRRLVVAFRGSLNYKHFTTNMDYGKRDVDILSLSMDKLDALDGLDVEQGAVNYERSLKVGFRKTSTTHQNLQAWEEEDDEEEDEDEDAGGGAFSRQSSLNTFSRQASFAQAGEGGNPEKYPSPRSSNPPRSVRNTIASGISLGGAGIKHVAGAIGGATVQILDQSAGLVRSAAKYTPVLQGLVKPYIHSGFWEAYSLVREFVHAVVRRELIEEPTDLFVTGHSLGGALGNIAALDLAVHTLPRINAYLAKKRRAADDAEVFSTSSSSPPTPLSDGSSVPMVRPRAPRFRRIKICQYSFGSPKVGNGSFAALVNKWVPDSFRVVVDGDVISSLPPTGYRHAGTECVVDRAGNGSIIIDRSFVERWLRPATVYSIRVHSLLTYHKGILGIRKAAEYFTAHPGESDYLYFMNGAFMKDKKELSFSLAAAAATTTTVPSSSYGPPVAKPAPHDVIPPPLALSMSPSDRSDVLFFSTKGRLDALDEPASPSLSDGSDTWRTAGSSTPLTPSRNPLHFHQRLPVDVTPMETPRGQDESEPDSEALEEEAEDDFEAVPQATNRSMRGVANKFLGLLGLAPYIDMRQVGEDMSRADIWGSRKVRSNV